MDITIRGLILILFCAFPFHLNAHGSSDTPLDKGFSWLHDQQLADGSFQTPLDKVAPLAATFESALAFSNSDQLEHIDVSAIDVFLSQQDLQQTEGLVRAIILKLRMGLTIDSEIESLMLHQNVDGGFGNRAGFDSTVYDSVFALQGLAVTQYRNAPESGRLIAYLIDQQNQDGGFSLDSGSPSSAYLTSLALRALQPYLYSYNIGEEMTLARDYLYAQVQTGSDWPSDWEAAQFLLSVIPLTTDVSRYQNSLTWLVTQQLANGSWQNDVYSTALSLQALYLAENITLPTAPDAAVVRGRVIDGASTQPLIGIAVGFEPDVGESVITDANGEFIVQGLQPNQYTLTYASDGFLTATQSLQVQAAQLVDLGTISLTVAPTTALLSGVVSDATQGNPIAGALVEAVIAAGSIQAVTDTSGKYSLVVDQGNTVINVSANGYRSISASANLIAGSAISFSPSLYLDAEEPQPLTLVGQVMDQVTLQPISVATVTHVASSTSVSSDQTGQFSFSGLMAGEQSFEVSAPGYQTVGVSLVLPEDGVVDMGAIQLGAIEQVDTTTVSGYVFDADSGAPIAGATVAVDGFAAQTDQNGYYSIAGITSLDFVVGANATGYVYGSSSVVLSQPKNLDVNITLLRANISGLSLDAVVTDKPQYNAYERVSFMATLSNQTVRERYVRLYVLIEDALGQVIDRFPATDIPAPSDTSDPEAIAHYEQHLAESVEVLAPNETRVVSLEQGWNTGIQIPGEYRVVVQALDGSTSQLISEQSIAFNVSPTEKLASIGAEVSPSFALMNSNPDVEISAQLRNSSNQPLAVQIGYEVFSPSGVSLMQGEQSLDVAPEEENKKVVLGALSHVYLESGLYQVVLTILDGVVPDALLSTELFVPPTVRLTVDQDINPETVIPGDERRVQVQIQVKGVDGE